MAVYVFFSFFDFFFFPLFYYCFNNNKRARGAQALARSWRPMGVLGRGRGEVSGGQRWRVKKEKVGESGLAQGHAPAHFPHSLPAPPHLPASTWLLTILPKVLKDNVSVSSLPALPHGPCHLPLSISLPHTADLQSSSPHHLLPSPLPMWQLPGHVPLPQALLPTGHPPPHMPTPAADSPSPPACTEQISAVLV